jgi:hypothetical protein
MVVLGLVLLLAAAALVVLIVAGEPSPDVVIDLLGGQRLTTAPVWIFVGGVATLLLAELGLMLVVRGTSRAANRRREIRRLREAARPAEPPAASPGATTDLPPDDEPDRVLVRDPGTLRVHQTTAGSAGTHRSPEEAADPQDAPHELRLPGGQDDERRRSH